MNFYVLVRVCCFYGKIFIEQMINILILYLLHVKSPIFLIRYDWMFLLYKFCRYPYMAVVLNFSQSWALYCLVQFYTALKDELAHIKPLAKFLVFKSIVFLTWWQGVAIALLYTWGLLKSPIAQALQFKSSIQDFIICIEVFNTLFYFNAKFRDSL